MNMEELRGKIDAVDEELLRAFTERMDIAGDIARYKAEHGLPVLDEQRERQKLFAVGEKGPEEAASPAQTAAAVFSGVYTAEGLPQHTELGQSVLGFAYAAPQQGGVTSGFGYRIHPIAGENRFHYGVDIDAADGSAIHAFADGTVGVVAQSSDLGNYVTVNHADGFSTLYAHCKRVTASAGQTVRCGDILGEVGQTGAATGPHLHFELHRDQVYINPIYYVA